jgi:2-keto-4-pentenoate hydratase/2-oxohepta-3-ene-1,7-dioic acid hydratase in catechol pathway
MKLALFDANGENHIGIVQENGLFDFSRGYQAYQLLEEGKMTAPLTDMVELMRAGLFGRELFEKILTFAAQHTLVEKLTVAGTPKLRAPIPNPAKLIALGGNFQFPGEPDPDEPPLFFKLASSVIGPDEPIICKKILKQVEPEIEVTVIIGRRASNVSRDEAMDYVAGYTILNDVTARDLQNVAFGTSRPWAYTKSIDTFTPMGPHLVLADAVTDPHNLAMTMRVNGEVVAAASTNTMIFQIPQLIEYISQYITLEPGDVIATGTPDHPGPLKPGDTVELEIAELGSLRNPVVAEA